MCFQKMDEFIGKDEAIVKDWLVHQGLEKLVNFFKGILFSILNIVNGIVVILVEIFITNGFYTRKYLMTLFSSKLIHIIRID